MRTRDYESWWRIRYRPTDRNNALREKLIEMAREQRRFGYGRLYVLAARDGMEVNHKRVWRVYRESGLAMKRVKRPAWQKKENR